MNQEEYLKFHRDFCDKAYGITAKKNSDYSRSKADAFSNFKVIEALRLASAEVGLICRITDKISRLCSFVSKGVLAVAEESVQDTILDAVNYLIILAAVIEDKKEKRNASKVQESQD